MIRRCLFNPEADKWNDGMECVSSQTLKERKVGAGGKGNNDVSDLYASEFTQ